MQFINFCATPEAHSSIPLYSSLVSAGFPNPAEEEQINKILDLNALLIPHPEATFMARADGDSMIDAGIHAGDLLIIDRSLTPKNGDIVLAFHDDGYLVKRFVKKQNQYFLCAENKSFAFKPLPITQNTIIWGVVSSVVKLTR